MQEIHQVFDKSFKRIMQEASSGAVIHFINGLFDADFPLDAQVCFPNKESVFEDLHGIIISDMLISVNGDHLFHLEAEIDDNLNMALRMFDYGYAEALKRKKPDADGVITLTFPQARVLYWETTKATPDTLVLRLVFPDNSVHNFYIKTFKVLDHKLKEMESLGLALLLPFHILKFRKRVKAMRNSEERLAMVPELTSEIENLLQTTTEFRKKGILTANDEVVIIGQIEILYNQIYYPYGEFREAKGMIDEMVMSSIDKALIKAKLSAAQDAAQNLARGKAEGKAEVAKTMLKDGLPIDAVIRYTGLSLADIEKNPHIHF
jgi:predicted transposase/invertase (TIGR01784 family)